MANQADGGNQKAGAVSGIDQEQQTQKERLSRQQPRRGRDARSKMISSVSGGSLA